MLADVEFKYNGAVTISYNAIASRRWRKRYASLENQLPSRQWREADVCSRLSPSLPNGLR
jgi:hypothetical protein